MLVQIWAKFNANEKLVAIGSGLVLLAWLLGAAGGGIGFGVSVLGLLGAIAALAILYLTHAPNTTVNWPVPIPVLLLGIGLIALAVGVLVLLQILPYLGTLATYFLGWILPFVIYLVGAALMAWGGYQEWNATRTTA